MEFYDLLGVNILTFIFFGIILLLKKEEIKTLKIPTPLKQLATWKQQVLVVPVKELR